MTTRSFAVDPRDPRAPSAEEWATMSEAERARAVDQLPSELPREGLPEGDPHRDPKDKALEALREYFRRQGRRVYLSGELPIYYPGEGVFAPDLIAVLDVEPHPRQRWVVSAEGKGLDFALEITLSGHRRKDLETNVDRYARLGIPEYCILGYRLDKPGPYESILPQRGRWSSRVLGLDLALELGRVRFFAGSAPLPHSEELIVRLESMLGELVSKERALADELEVALDRAEAEKARAEAEKARAEAEKARAEAEGARADRLATRLRELGLDDESKS
jgi:Uma2 family endonuclease